MAREVEETAVPTNDAYTGMLAISLLALIAGCVFLYLDWSQYPDKTPPRPNIPKVAPVNAGGGAAPAPAPAPNPMGMPPMGAEPKGAEPKAAEPKEATPPENQAQP